MDPFLVGMLVALGYGAVAAMLAPKNSKVKAFAWAFLLGLWLTLIISNLP